MGKGTEEFMEKALNDNKKRRFLYQLRPPYYWNFFEECKEEDESVTQNLILTGFKLCKSCRVSKIIFPL